MKVTVELCVIPLGVGLSLSEYIAACERIVREAGLQSTLHAFGTNIEGEWDQVFAAVRRCHEELHRLGVPRIHTSLKIGTRTDKSQSLDDKIASVEALLR